MTNKKQTLTEKLKNGANNLRKWGLGVAAGALLSTSVAAQSQNNNGSDPYTVPNSVMVSEEGKKVNIGLTNFYGNEYITTPGENGVGVKEIYPFSKDIISYNTDGDKIKDLSSDVVYSVKPSEHNKVKLKQEGESVFGIGGNESRKTKSEDPVLGQSNFSVSDPGQNLRAAVFENNPQDSADNDTIYFSYVSPNTDSSIAKGEKLDFVLANKENTEITKDAQGNVYLEGAIYRPVLNREKSDADKLFSKDSTNAIVTSEENIEGLNPYRMAGSSDSLNKYRVPTDSLPENLPASANVEYKDKNILNSKDYIKNNKSKIEKSVQNNGTPGEVEEFMTVEGVEKAKKNRGSELDLGNWRLNTSVNAYLGGLNNSATGGASATISPQVKTGEGVWLGIYGNFSPQYFASVTSKTKTLDEDKELVNANSGTYKTVTGKKDIETIASTPYDAGLKANFSVGDNSEMYISVGAAKQNKTENIDGSKTVTYIRDDDTLSSNTLYPENESITRNYENWGASVGAGYEHYFGNNWGISLGLKARYFDDLNLSGNLGVKYSIGNKSDKKE